MPRLVASNIEQRDTVYRQWMLEEGVVLPLGRAVAKDHVLIEWDEQVAPRHAVLAWDKGRLQVDRCSGLAAEQPVFYAGRECESFSILPGEGFVVGKTVFRLDPAVTIGQSSEDEAHAFLCGGRHPHDERQSDGRAIDSRPRAPVCNRIEATRLASSQLVVATVRRVIRTASYAAVVKVVAAKQQLSAIAESEASPVCAQGSSMTPAGGRKWSSIAGIVAKRRRATIRWLAWPGPAASYRRPTGWARRSGDLSLRSFGRSERDGEPPAYDGRSDRIHWHRGLDFALGKDDRRSAAVASLDADLSTQADSQFAIAARAG